MRHQKAGKKLNRSRKHRKSLLRNLVLSLVEHGQIRTTEAKAKAVRPLVDKVLTQAKKGRLAANRRLEAFLHNKKAVGKLITEIVPKFKGRSSGFTRMVKLGQRTGDRAMMVKLEFVETFEKPKAVSSVPKRVSALKKPRGVRKNVKVNRNTPKV